MSNAEPKKGRYRRGGLPAKPPVVVKAGEFKLNDAAKRLLEKVGVRG